MFKLEKIEGTPSIKGWKGPRNVAMPFSTVAEGKYEIKTQGQEPWVLPYIAFNLADGKQVAVHAGQVTDTTINGIKLQKSFQIAETASGTIMVGGTSDAPTATIMIAEASQVVQG